MTKCANLYLSTLSCAANILQSLPRALGGSRHRQSSCCTATGITDALSVWGSSRCEEEASAGEEQNKQTNYSPFSEISSAGEEQKKQTNYSPFTEISSAGNIKRNKLKLLAIYRNIQC